MHLKLKFVALIVPPSGEVTTRSMPASLTGTPPSALGQETPRPVTVLALAPAHVPW
jgi:hypothetical protein